MRIIFHHILIRLSCYVSFEVLKPLQFNRVLVSLVWAFTEVSNERLLKTFNVTQYYWNNHHHFSHNAMWSWSFDSETLSNPSKTVSTIKQWTIVMEMNVPLYFYFISLIILCNYYVHIPLNLSIVIFHISIKEEERRRWKVKMAVLLSRWEIFMHCTWWWWCSRCG